MEVSNIFPRWTYPHLFNQLSDVRSPVLILSRGTYLVSELKVGRCILVPIADGTKHTNKQQNYNWTLKYIYIEDKFYSSYYNYNQYLYQMPTYSFW